jgi:hypothetical protein
VLFEHLQILNFLLGTLCYLTIVPLYQVVWNTLSPNDHLYHDLLKNLLSILTQVQNHQLHLTQNSSKYFDYPIQQYDIEVIPYQDLGEKVEEKTRSWRQNKKLKRRQGDDEKQEDQEKIAQVKKMKEINLKFSNQA